MADVVRTFSLTPASERNLSSLSSRRVRKQNMEWSKGAIFLIATLRPDGLWMAEHTMPYAPSPTTSRTWYWVPARAGEMGEVSWSGGSEMWKGVRTNVEADFSGRRLGLGGGVGVLGLCGSCCGGGLGSVGLFWHGGSGRGGEERREGVEDERGRQKQRRTAGGWLYRADAVVCSTAFTGRPEPETPEEWDAGGACSCTEAASQWDPPGARREDTPPRRLPRGQRTPTLSLRQRAGNAHGNATVSVDSASVPSPFAH